MPSGTMVEDGDGIQLSLEASADFDAAVEASFTIAGISRTFTVTTRAAATDPVGFIDFEPVIGAQRNVLVVSNAQTIADLDQPSPISVVGGAYAIDGGPFVTAPGTVAGGQEVAVQAASSGAFSTPVTATLTIGSVSAGFTVTTEDEDVTPDGFVDFSSVSPAELDTVYTSSPQVIAGLNTTTTASIAAGNGADLGPVALSVNGGAFTAGPAAVANGDSIVARLTTGSSFATAYSADLTVGSVIRSFSALTAGADVDPDNLADFPPVANAAIVSTVTSAPSAPISGINTAAPISIVGGRYAIDGGSYTDAPGVIHAGSTVRIAITTGSGFLAPHAATLTIGSVLVQFVATTAPADTTPDDLGNFAATTGAEINAPYPSETKAVLGINAPAPVSIAGGSNAEFQVLNASQAVVRAWSNAPATVPVGGFVRVRQMLGSYATTATLTVGGVPATYALTTRDAVITPTSLTNFAPVTGANPSTDVASATQTVYGIEIPVNATVSIAGGGQAAFRVDNGSGWSAYSAADKTANIGSQVQVRITTPAAFSATSTATLAVGGVQATFAVTTRAANTKPTNYVDFTSGTGLEPGAVGTSNIQTINGLETPASVSISPTNNAQSQARNSSNAVVRAWGTVTTTVPVGGKVEVRHTASSSFSTMTYVGLTVGGVTRYHYLTTRIAIVSPPDVDFTPVTGANPGIMITSNIHTISGLDTLPRVMIWSITPNGNSTEFRILNSNNTVYRDWGAARVNLPHNGAKVQVRIRSSNTSKATTSTVISIAGSKRTFSVTTK